MLNSILSEICVLRVIKVRIVKDFIFEAIMTVGFILAAVLLPLWMGCLVYAGLFVLYGIANYKSIVKLFKQIFARRKKSDNDYVNKEVEE